MHSKPRLTVKNLSVSLRGKPVLQGIDWQVEANEQWAIVGPNGSGKTTLVKALAGILPSSVGSITFHLAGGADDVSTARGEFIAFVSAEMHHNVFEREVFAEEVRHFTGDDSKILAGMDFILDRAAGVAKTQAGHVDELQTLSRKLGMRKLLYKKISALTTGEISKIIILKALLKKPQILILDEPFNGLDRRSKETLAELIGDLTRTGMLVIMITHRLDEIIPEISHVLVMTSEGIQKMGFKNVVLQSTVIQQIYGINHDPLDRDTTSTLQAASQKQARVLTSDSATDFPAGTKLVEMLDVSVRYDQQTVLQNLHWTIRKGENWMVCGSDGAGKTSLLKLITGDNLQAYANDIYLFGQKKGSGESVWEIKQKIGWVSSDLQSKYPLKIKGAEVVYSGFFDSIGLYRTASTAQRQHATELLIALGIDHLAEETYGHLSHGQKQMLLIARAMVKFPLLLLLDEPCEGLDLANRRKILEIIELVGRQTSTTLVYATHDDDEVLPCISHQLRLDRGKTSILTTRH